VYVYVIYCDSKSYLFT